MKDLTEETFDLEVTTLGKCLRSCWEDQESASPLPLTRSLTLNHIGVGLAQHESFLLAAIERLQVRHPCRAFLVMVDRDATELKAELRSYTREHRLNRSLRLELIHITVSPADVPKISNLILPVLVNDLPTQLFWNEGPQEDLRFLAQLSAMSDQLVYDSSLFPEPMDEIKLFEHFQLERVDLTWLRLTPWRRGLAEAFEHFEWQAEAETKVEIHHNHTAGSRASSQLMGNWLRTKLNAQIKYISHAEPGPSGVVPIGLSIQNAGSVVELQYNNDAQQIQAKVSTPDLCLVPFQLIASDSSRGDLLTAAADLCWT